MNQAEQYIAALKEMYEEYGGVFPTELGEAIYDNWERIVTVYELVIRVPHPVVMFNSIITGMAFALGVEMPEVPQIPEEEDDDYPKTRDESIKPDVDDVELDGSIWDMDFLDQ